MIETINKYVKLFQKVQDYKTSTSRVLTNDEIDINREFEKYHTYLISQGLNPKDFTGKTNKFKFWPKKQVE